MTKKINLKITKNNQKTEKIEKIIIKNFLMIQKTKKNIKIQIMISMTIKTKKNIINKI